MNYVVQGDEVIIVDEFTGRLMPGRQWSDGLHQAVEAKEGVRRQGRDANLCHDHAAKLLQALRQDLGHDRHGHDRGREFWKIYKLDVIAIPTNKGMQRLNFPDVIYRSEREKYEAIVEEIERLHKWDVLELKDRTHKVDDRQGAGRPDRIRVEREMQALDCPQERHHRRAPARAADPGRHGSIEKSERLPRCLNRRGIKHEVLNAKHHQREAEIVAQAGRKNAVTIATNMAGRGTDIILGGNPETMAWALLQDKYPHRLDVPQDEWNKLVREIEAAEKMKAEGREVKALGGLHIVGTERHEARRIDLQLRGRAGRQGDPGSSRFFLSLEDDLMRIFAGEWVKNMLTRLGMQEAKRSRARW